MSSMAYIDTELELNWWTTGYGYRHAHSDYRIVWWNSNRDTVSVYRHTADEWLPVLHGVDLATAVHHVMQEV